MPKKTKAAKIYEGLIFSIGDSVKINRPNLWLGYSGCVSKVNEATGEHIIRVDAKDGKPCSPCDAPALGTELEIWI